MLYKNTGAPFNRADGSRVERDAIFEPALDELVQRRYKLKPVVAERRPRDPYMLTSSRPFVREEMPEGDPRWPLRMDRKTYLSIHPEGKHAQLARELEAEGKEGDRDANG